MNRLKRTHETPHVLKQALKSPQVYNYFCFLGRVPFSISLPSAIGLSALFYPVSPSSMPTREQRFEAAHGGAVGKESLFFDGPVGGAAYSRYCKLHLAITASFSLPRERREAARHMPSEARM